MYNYNIFFVWVVRAAGVRVIHNHQMITIISPWSCLIIWNYELHWFINYTDISNIWYLCTISYMDCINIPICDTRSNNVVIHSRFEYRILFSLMITLLTYTNISDYTITFSLIMVFEARLFKNLLHIYISHHICTYD